MFVIELESNVIGSCDVTLGESEGRTVGELTVLIGVDHRRNGYAKSGLEALAQWASENLPVEELWGTCVEDNTASISLMSSLGMECDGLVQSYEGRSVWKFRWPRPSSE
jgi:RimJ/RimL family protein N-acetyltransferase